MGWYDISGSLEDLIADRTRDYCVSAGLVEIIDHHLSEDHTELWTLRRHAGDTWIHVDLLERRSGRWWYKPMCEQVGPYYYQCPIEWLDKTTCYESPEWRKRMGWKGATA